MVNTKVWSGCYRFACHMRHCPRATGLPAACDIARVSPFVSVCLLLSRSLSHPPPSPCNQEALCSRDRGSGPADAHGAHFLYQRLHLHLRNKVSRHSHTTLNLFHTSSALRCPAFPCASLLCFALPVPALHLPFRLCAARPCPALPFPALRCPPMPCTALP